MVFVTPLSFCRLDYAHYSIRKNVHQHLFSLFFGTITIIYFKVAQAVEGLIYTSISYHLQNILSTMKVLPKFILSIMIRATRLQLDTSMIETHNSLCIKYGGPKALILLDRGGNHQGIA